MRLINYLKERKSKIITFTCMIVILLSLYATCYLLFFRTTDVDVTENISLTYHGESESAFVEVLNDKANYNQRIQEFIDAIEYSVDPSTNLKNGDVITVTAAYDSELANRYHIQPIHTEREIIVKDLPERLSDSKQLTSEFLNALTKRSESYLKKHIDQILNEDFTIFYLNTEPKLVETRNVYRLFLDAKDNSQKDKVVDIYSIKAKGEVNTSAEGIQLEEKESLIYYMITYNEINTSLTVTNETIYGEKVMIAEGVDLLNTEGFQTYLSSKYHDNYIITILNQAS